MERKKKRYKETRNPRSTNIIFSWFPGLLIVLKNEEKSPSHPRKKLLTIKAVNSIVDQNKNKPPLSKGG